MKLTRVIPPLIPTVAALSMPEITIAQTQQPPTIAPPVSVDPLAAGGYVLAIVISGFAILPQVLAKFVNQNLEGRQKVAEAKLDQEKGMAQVFIERTDKSAEAIESILRLSLANNFDNLRRQIELNYEYQKRLAKLEDVLQALLDRIDRHERALEYIESTQKDILAALQMHERKDKE
jgi:hypothetical protein